MQYERLDTAGFTWKHAKSADRVSKAAAKSGSETELPMADGYMQKPKTVDKTEKAISAAPTTVETQGSVNQGYDDITDNWYPDATPGSHPVQDLQEYVVDGKTYKVDGRNVQISYKPYEKEIAELLEREVGGEIFMVPRVNNPQGVSTPDYIFNGKAYDLKTLSKEATKDTIFNRVKKARKQAHNFIIDVTEASLSDEDIENQIKKLFENNSTVFVDEIVVIRNGKIKKVAKRKKS